MGSKRESPYYPVGYVVSLTGDTFDRADYAFLSTEFGREREVVYIITLTRQYMTLFGFLIGTKLNHWG